MQKDRIKAGILNIEFKLASIDRLPLKNQTIDLVISNCVINLCPDKMRVVQEVFRVLKPGSRVSIADIALHRKLPDAIVHESSAYSACISGAVLIEDFRKMFVDCGFEDIRIESLSGPQKKGRPLYFDGQDLSDYGSSIILAAIRPKGPDR